MIISINGKIGSGKDTIGRIIQWLTVEQHTRDFWQGSFDNFNEAMIEGYHPIEGWQIRKFADKLKEICSLLTGIPRADFEKAEVKNSYLEKEWDFVWQHDSDGWMRQRMTVRTFMQRIGTEAMRDHVHENVWVNALFAEYTLKNREYRTSLDYPNWIITDLRFENEMQAVKERNGIIIRVERDGTDVGSTHPSETALDNARFDFCIINDGTIEDLIVNVRAILLAYEIIK